MFNTCLALRRQEVDHLLNSARSVHIEGDVDEVLGDRFANDVALLVGRVLEELLAEIVPEWICKSNRSIIALITKDENRSTSHKLCEVSESFAEDHIPVLRDALLELLLQVTAPVLVLAQAWNLADEVLKTRAGEAVNYKWVNVSVKSN